MDIDMSLYIPIEDFCEKLRISNVTANNWIKKEKIKRDEYPPVLG